MREPVNIFSDLVESLNEVVQVDSVTDNTDGTFTLAMCETKWLRGSSGLNSFVNIEGTDYPVVSVVYNESITITAASLPVFTELTIPAPMYIHGTWRAVVQEREGIKDSNEKMPYVWLVEPFLANDNPAWDSIIESVPELTLMLLDESDINWETPRHYTDVIIPMDELANSLIQKIRATRSLFGEITSQRRIRHAKFGEQFKEGHKNSILNERTSGVELRISVEILKNLQCSNC